MSNKQLPAEVQEQIENKAQHYSNYNEDENRKWQPIDKGRYYGYKAGAIAYAAELHQVQGENQEWKDECERLAGLVEYWQGKYNELNGSQTIIVPKIDNNPIA